MSAVADFRNVVGGELVDATTGAWDDVLAPATGETIGRVPAGAAADVSHAVAAAGAAAPAWGETAPAGRQRALLGLADLLEDHGRNLSAYALEEYTRVKHVMAKLD